MTTFRDSTIITGFDASPIVRPTAGQGGAVHKVVQFATITGVTGDTSSYTYRMVRLPTNSMVHRVLVTNDVAVTTWAGSIGLYFSDANDGTPAPCFRAARTRLRSSPTSSTCTLWWLGPTRPSRTSPATR